MPIKTYTNRPSAVRGLARHLGTANTEGLDLASLIEQDGNQFTFDTDAADAMVGLGGLSEEDENLTLACGHVNCPHCGIHLRNGLMDFDNAADRAGSEKAAFKTMKHEWQCMGCNGEWGKPIVLTASTAKPNKSGRPSANRERSSIEKPCTVVWAIADAMPTAPRKEVVVAAVAKGVHPGTAATQYQHWRKAHGLSKSA